MFNEKFLLSKTKKRKGLLLILIVGMILFVWRLGSTGLIDETPPLFAAAGRAMPETGDWLTPKVNGIVRFDKPPLFYWLMGIFYSFPKNETWDVLGTWSARLPSALSSLILMLVIGETLMSAPQGICQYPRRTAFVASLSFALSPLVIIWSRISVSDSLFSATLGLSLIFLWKRYANPSQNKWFIPWIFLALSILTKGPVALVIAIVTITIFSILQRDTRYLFDILKPFKGLALALVISLPWYIIELIIEGKPFFDSFFGYHNFQRLTSVVNSHNAPWWFFVFILVLSSLPFSPFLITGIFSELKVLVSLKNKRNLPRIHSLNVFSLSWLCSIFIIFTSAATKLPSYWIPAVPAASIMIAISSQDFELRSKYNKKPIIFVYFLCIIFAIILISSPYWIVLINDPELPDLGNKLIQSEIYFKGSLLIFVLTTISILLTPRLKFGKLITFQIPFILFHLTVFQPLLNIADDIRQLPIRDASRLILAEIRNQESLAMVGIIKPSLHFYTRKVIIYESNDDVSLINLSERLSSEKRFGWEGRPIFSPQSESVIIVIDDATSQLSHWSDLNHEQLGKFGIYNVWRLNRKILLDRANTLRDRGIESNWRLPRQEKF